MNLCKTAVQDNNILIQIAEPGLVYLGRFNITAPSDALCGPLVENFQFKMLQMNANVRGKMQQQKIGCDTVCVTGSELLFVYHGADVYWVQLRREGGILACRLLQIVPTCHSCVKFLELQSGCAENAKRIVTSFQDLGGSTGWKVKGCQVAQMGRIMLFFSSKIKQNVGGAFFGFLDLDTQNRFCQIFSPIVELLPLFRSHSWCCKACMKAYLVSEEQMGMKNEREPWCCPHLTEWHTSWKNKALVFPKKCLNV